MEPANRMVAREELALTSHYPKLPMFCALSKEGLLSSLFLMRKS